MQSSQNTETEPAQTSGLTPQDFDRYARQLAVPELGAAGQQRLKASKVAVVGAGGLGSPVLSYLAAAGVGALTVIDADTVAESNLHRQPLHGQPDLNCLKVDSAATALERLNPEVRVERRPIRLTGDNALELLAGHDAIVDGSDNFDTHYCLD
ncbi:MAG: HesA/MoeB/ThiF family protein, partial [Mycobacteriales bacterium]